jgi:hypothetical protein
MKIVQDADRLVLEDSPGCFWFPGLFFVAIGGIVVAGVLVLFYNLGEAPTMTKNISLLLGMAAVGTGIYLIYTAPKTQAIFDAQTGRVTIQQRGLFRNTILERGLTEIAELYVDEKADSDGDPVYRPRMRLHSGLEVDLSHLWIHRREDCEEVVKVAEEFLFDL